MRRAVMAVVGVVALLSLAASSAGAKGLSSLTITGVDLDEPIVLDSGSPLTSQQMMHVAEAARMYDAASADHKPMAKSGAAELGPKFVATYVDGARGTTFVQHLYPFAQPKAVAFAPSQETWDGRTTSAGWIEPTKDLEPLLSGLGIDAPVRPGNGGRSASSLTWMPALAGLAVTLAAVAAWAVRRRKGLASPGLPVPSVTGIR